MQPLRSIPVTLVSLLLLAPLPALAQTAGETQPETTTGGAPDDAIDASEGDAPVPESAGPTTVVEAPSLTVPPPPAETVAEAAPSSGPIVELRPGQGLDIASADRQFSLQVNARAQVMAIASFPHGIGAAADGGDAANDPQLGFALRRARIILSGNFWGADNVYKIELGLSPQDMAFVNGNPTRTPLMDWYIEMRQLRDLNVRVGQFKVAYGRQFYLSAGRLQMADLSAITNEFSLDRDIGVQISSSDLFGLGLFRYRAGVTTGEGRDGGFGRDFGLLYFARVDVLPFGLFDDMTEADLERLPRPRLSIGAAYAFLDNGSRMGGITGPLPQDAGTSDYHFFDADVLFMHSGFSLLAQLFARSGWRQAGNAVDSSGNLLPVTAPRNGVGWFVQAGYVLPGIPLEISARYGMTSPIGSPTETSMPDMGELGGGLSYYLSGNHAYKIQADFFQIWNNGFDNFGTGEQRLRLLLTASL